MKDKITFVHDDDYEFVAIYVGDKRVYDGEPPPTDQAIRAVGLPVTEYIAPANANDVPDYYPKSLKVLKERVNSEKRRRARVSQLAKKIAAAHNELAKLENA